MKIAFLILTHKNPGMLKRTLRTMDDPRFDFFVHVDAKADLGSYGFEDYGLCFSRLTVLPERVRCHWGDISLSDAMFALYRCAAAAGGYDWYAFLSGEDYPVMSNEDICEWLARQTEDCIRMAPSDRLHIRGWWFWTLPSRLLVRIIRKGTYMLGLRKKPYFTVGGKRWHSCTSSQWLALKGDTVRHLLAVYDQTPAIRRYFRFSHAPDEKVIATILYNAPPRPGYTEHLFYPEGLPFDQRAVLHFLEYVPPVRRQKRPSSVRIFDESDYGAAISSGKPFLRKVREGTSDGLIALLEEKRREKEPARR